MRTFLLKLLLPKKFMLITFTDKLNVETTFNDKEIQQSGNAIYFLGGKV